MNTYNEITIELTNYCIHNCKYCSTNTIDNFKEAYFLDIDTIQKTINNKQFNHIILSGGEPLSHPNFYSIYKLCEDHTDDVVIYSNLIKHLVYNANVIDGIYLEANITVTPETDKIHILRRIKQGREINRPEIHLSKNHIDMNCLCNHRVLRYDGEIVKTPCDKYNIVKDKKEN